MMDIYFTSDVHGYLSPRDFYKQDRKAGYLVCAEHFRQDALVLDGGDSLQGSPLAMYALDNKLPFPQAEAFRAAGLRYFVPGNHDFNFGEAVLERYIRETGAVCLAANVYSSVLSTEPYAVYTSTDGLRIGLVGIVTDYVNVWEKKENLKSTNILDSVRCASQALKEVRTLGADYVFCIYHGGYENSFSGSPIADTIENRASEIMALGFDAVLTSHQHMRRDCFIHNGVFSLQNAANGQSFAHITVDRENGISGKVLSADECEVYHSEAVASALSEINTLNDKVDIFLSERIGRAEPSFEDRDKLESMRDGSTLADFFNQVQLKSTGADVSVCALFNEPVSIGPEVSIGDVIKAYPFPNNLFVIEADGAVLKAALERSASFFEIKDGSIAIADSALNPKAELYNYDYCMGAEYTFDISKPVGERVVQLAYKGIDLCSHPETKFTIVLNSYRISGTGGYEMYTSCPVVRSYADDFQQLLIDTFRKEKDVKLELHSTFRCVL